MRPFFWGVGVIICSIAGAAKSDGIPSAVAEKMLTGHWIGKGKGSDGPYQFHTVNCANGRFAVAVLREEQDTSIYFGSWETDGATIKHTSDLSGTFEQQSLDMRSIEPVHFSNSYHIIELTEYLSIYEWRGSSTRRFEARKTEKSLGNMHEKLEHLACAPRPSLS